MLERQTVGEELAARLRRRILDGELLPGAPLREATLAGRYGASRPSVRDALRQLDHEGLVQHETHRGARVTRLTRDEVRDILALRTIVEPAVIRRYGLPADLRDRLAGYVDRLESAAAADDWPSYGEADVGFHETLVAAARSARLSEAHGRAMRQLLLYLVSVDRAASSPGPDRRHVAEHRRMAELLAADEREEGARLLGGHLDDALAALLQREGAGGGDT